ncbi:MAG: hypothetical protein NZL96_02890 [Patescibacteria group bacterium]|nr:hypothetical protein [Patescibacteria group bacterium]
MKKRIILDETFEQLKDLTNSTAKQAVKAINQAFNPLNYLLSQEKPSHSSVDHDKEKKNIQPTNHTPLNLEKLTANYQEQKRAQMKVIREELFRIVKGWEHQSLERKRSQEKEEERKRTLEEQKKQKIEEEKKKSSQQDIPQGKIRRSIFNPKKIAQRQHQEVRASFGKQ